jgi:hypothetical protein
MTQADLKVRLYARLCKVRLYARLHRIDVDTV